MCSKEVPLCIVQFPLAIENLKQLICDSWDQRTRVILEEKKKHFLDFIKNRDFETSFG